MICPVAVRTFRVLLHFLQSARMASLELAGLCAASFLARTKGDKLVGPTQCPSCGLCYIDSVKTATGEVAYRGYCIGGDDGRMPPPCDVCRGEVPYGRLVCSRSEHNAWTCLDQMREGHPLFLAKLFPSV